jgi:putative SOS response-associated peptidase YedK
MCGRIVRSSPLDAIRAAFDATPTGPLDLRPRWNVCPGEEVLAVASVDGTRRLRTFRWGLVLGFVADPAKGPRPINVRAEGVLSRPAFREALRRRRCLVVADGFYEWQREGTTKVPYFLHLRSGRLFGLAALWERWRGRDGATLETCAILTCAPNALVAGIHGRMPVILSPAACTRWLDPTIEDPRALVPLLGPHAADEMEAWPVSGLVNTASNDLAACVERV